MMTFPMQSRLGYPVEKVTMGYEGLGNWCLEPGTCNQVLVPGTNQVRGTPIALFKKALTLEECTLTCLCVVYGEPLLS